MGRAIVIGLAVCVAAMVAVPRVTRLPAAPIPPGAEEVSLLLIDWVPDQGRGEDVKGFYRLLRIRLRQGVSRGPETVWEGDSELLGQSWDWLELIDNRFVVTGAGGVIDVQAKKLINVEKEGDR